MLNAYCTGHIHSRMVCGSFAAGCGAPIVPPAPLLPGDVFMYGCLRGLRPTLSEAQRQGRRWIYADNGYFRPGHHHGFYRVTENAFQHDGSGDASVARWEALGLSIAPWRAAGRHVLVCPPSEVFAGLMGFDARRWLDETVQALNRSTDREVRVRTKANAPTKPLAADMAGAWALVTHSSNAAVEALLAGIPVFCTAPCAAQRMGLSDLSLIENPACPDGREPWAWNLAAAQWTLEEMASGLCWRMLNGEC